MDVPDKLYNKYHITHTDNTPTDANAEYFVLRVDDHNNKDHASAVASLIFYALMIASFNPALSKDIIQKYGDMRMQNTKTGKECTAYEMVSELFFGPLQKDQIVTDLGKILSTGSTEIFAAYNEGIKTAISKISEM